MMRIAVVVGYFDWFSGYQETALTQAFGVTDEVEVIASDRVNPIFSDSHLLALGVARRYEAQFRDPQNGVKVTRFRSAQWRSMVWSRQAVRYLRQQDFDLVIQMMPGQGLPIAATIANSGTVRVAMYGDNAAMWAALTPLQKRLKWLVFAMTKGVAYRFVNERARHVYCYTPETVDRLGPFVGKTTASVLPLAFDPSKFCLDFDLRQEVRADLGYSPEDIVILAAGKFQRTKRLELLCAAVKELAPRHANLRLLIVGDDHSEYADEFKRHVSEDDLLASATQFLEFQDSARLNALFNAADVGVWPRQPAITIQQAMATGLQVVLPHNDWVGHLIRDHAGIYFNEETVRAIAEAIEQEISNSGEITRQGRAEINSWLSSPNIAEMVRNHISPDAS